MHDCRCCGIHVNEPGKRDCDSCRRGECDPEETWHCDGRGGHQCDGTNCEAHHNE